MQRRATLFSHEEYTEFSRWSAERCEVEQHLFDLFAPPFFRTRTHEIVNVYTKILTKVEFCGARFEFKNCKGIDKMIPSRSVFGHTVDSG